MFESLRCLFNTFDYDNTLELLVKILYNIFKCKSLGDQLLQSSLLQLQTSGHKIGLFYTAFVLRVRFELTTSRL